MTDIRVTEKVMVAETVAGTAEAELLKAFQYFAYGSSSFVSTQFVYLNT